MLKDPYGRNGSEHKTVKLYAYVTEKESYVSCLDINIGVQSPDVPIPYTNNAPTYDWQFGSIVLTDAISSTKTVTVKLVNGNGVAKNNSEKVLNNSTKVSFNDNSGHHYYYVPSSKTLYYCSTNGSAGSSAGRYSIVLSQEGRQSVTITPDTKKVYYTVDYDYTGSATSPTITIDETGDDIRIPIIYYDPTTGRTYNHSTFFVPSPLKSNFSDFNNRDDRESYMDYMDDDGGGKFGYAVDDEYDDMAPGYITIYGLHPGQGYVDLNSGDGMWACQDLHLQVNIEEVETGLVELGEFHSEFAMRPDDNRYLTVGSIPTSAVLRHVSNGTIPSSYSAAATAWTNASSTSDYLKNISVYSTGKLKFEEPGKNRTGWYACGSYVGKLSKTNPHTSQSYNTYYTFQIYQDVPIGIGVAFEQGTGSSTGTTFNWKSNRIKVYPVPFMRAWNKEYNMLSRIQQYFPQIYAKFYYSDETRYVYQQTLSVPQPEMSEEDYNGVYVYGESDWFQISGTWINKTSGQWNVTSGSDTEYRVSDGLTSHTKFCSPKPLFEIALSSSGYFDNIILINDDNASVSNSIGGGWWYFYLEPSVERTNSSSVVHEYAFPIEQFYSDWSNY